MRLLFLGLMCWALAGLASAADLNGEVALFVNGKPLRKAEAVDAVVYFRPAVPVKPEAMPTSEMRMFRKTFAPRVLVTTVGSKVTFPNDDLILHNAFSLAPKNNFDAQLYGHGEAFEHLFENPGLVKVYCNVHFNMVGTILVVDTPFFAKPDSQGRFKLKDLPAAGELFVWHERAKVFRKAWISHPEGPLQIRLDLTVAKIPPHTNKLGQPYQRARGGRY
jgi:plastocyanin